jgi:hypothetical protein
MQSVAQIDPAQAYPPAQGDDVPAPQVPLATQLAPLVVVVPLQVAERHGVDVGAWVHPAPVPSQSPGEHVASTPVPAAQALWGSCPAGTAAHVPRDALKLQAMHPVQVLLQHTPSAQWSVVHSASAMQSAPVGLGPHEPSVQGLPPAHCAGSVHVWKQEVASLQRKGAQVDGVDGAQTPLPSHIEAAVNELSAELQMAALHSVVMP